ncbi:phage portal protein [Nocardioides carbamazepini]|uniref:hypothetical protein n=1 Tax=Nocardioides carbamazepini TaxID=2854259 RepID=UPI00214A6A2F|nr:hypothetical protein [Nocardioides carbamazepini]MCR1785312.1 phage portal protein [Nocardioides carbamazepini]
MAQSKTVAVPDLEHGEQNTLDQLVMQWRSKRQRNNLRTGFYDMANATRHLMSSTAPPSVKKKSFVLGWSTMAVDKLARRCNLDGVYDRAGRDLDSLGMHEIWKTNRLGSEVSQAGVSGLIHSVSWLVTTLGDIEAGEPKALINARSALTGTGVWDGRRRALSSFLSINELDDKGEPTDMTMYLPNLNVFMTKTPTGWTVTRRDHKYGVPVDPMRYKPRIDRPFGSSRITRAAMSFQGQALGAMIRGDVNGEAYSLPRYVLLGAGEDAFRNADGTIKPTWQAAWDAIWAIGDDEEVDDPKLARADVKQFHGQSPEPQNAHLRMLAQMFSGETGIPLGELGILGDSNPTSYDALLASRDDIIATAEATMDDWGPDVSSAVTRALAMYNDEDLPADLDVQCRWRPAQHVSRAAAADAGAKILAQVPWLTESQSDVALELLGLRPDQINRANNDRRRAAGRDLLNRLRERQQTGTGGVGVVGGQTGRPADGNDNPA